MTAGSGRKRTGRSPRNSPDTSWNRSTVVRPQTASARGSPLLRRRGPGLASPPSRSGILLGHEDLLAQVEAIRIPSHARKREVPGLLVQLGSLRELCLLACERLRTAYTTASTAKSDADKLRTASERANARADAAAADVSASQAAAKAQQARLKSELAALTADAASRESELSTELERVRAELKQALTTIKRKDTLIANRDAALAESQGKLEVSSNKLASCQAALQRARIDAAEASRAAVQAKVAADQAKSEASSVQRTREMEAAEEEAAHVTELKLNLRRKTRHLAEVKAALAQVQAQNEALEAKAEKRAKLRSAVQAARESEARINDHAAAQKLRIDQLTHELQATQMELGTVHAKYAKLQRSHAKLKKRLDSGSSPSPKKRRSKRQAAASSSSLHGSRNASPQLDASPEPVDIHVQQYY
ncbi:uncharacterized protein AMSG_00157 [Thecamonas trahens ATCC 50062]|uniref:Uncharacterized protein n=1 Tax=Thecamonas trahens ATCC 50062 TaxID=461836 RepID=A0A0L0D403_THETB|nr:hypothetical protein AMSG_00157 [Thecamonas trahens ATCC 50062]KNC46038.1 hypothetical protein AMSG_00157 [Thecamonas trahens ATCC 50062]|eukprot:XP_013763018.1 hypothetical protein AMSG_00157 [Thecamonas trahens ATCC 50062]